MKSHGENLSSDYLRWEIERVTFWLYLHQSLSCACTFAVSHAHALVYMYVMVMQAHTNNAQGSDWKHWSQKVILLSEMIKPYMWFCWCFDDLYCSHFGELFFWTQISVLPHAVIHLSTCISSCGNTRFRVYSRMWIHIKTCIPGVPRMFCPAEIHISATWGNTCSVAWIVEAWNLLFYNAHASNFAQVPYSSISYTKLPRPHFNTKMVAASGLARASPDEWIAHPEPGQIEDKNEECLKEKVKMMEIWEKWNHEVIK